MNTNGPLTRSFFQRACLEVARDLVGALVVRRLEDGTRIVGRLIEVEAYLGDGKDPGSHSWRGPTPRNRTMFGPPGRIYAYRSYGVHICVNLVCEEPGRGAAVLLRALEPLEGVDAMRIHRGLAPEARGRVLASGPGRLAQALALGLEHDGASALRGEVTLRPPARTPRIGRGPRVGLSRGADLLYRLFDADSDLVSPWRPGVRRRS